MAYILRPNSYHDRASEQVGSLNDYSQHEKPLQADYKSPPGSFPMSYFASCKWEFVVDCYIAAWLDEFRGILDIRFEVIRLHAHGKPSRPLPGCLSDRVADMQAVLAWLENMQAFDRKGRYMQSKMEDMLDSGYMQEMVDNWQWSPDCMAQEDSCEQGKAVGSMRS